MRTQSTGDRMFREIALGTSPCSAASRYRISSFFVRSTAPLGLALVPQLLALCEGEFQFHSPILEIHPGRDQCQAALLSFTDKLAKLLFVYKQLSGAQWRMVKNISIVVGAYMAI